jgi:hypothetical protein
MSEWIGQLQHPDSRRRKAGIAALAKSKQTAALGDLEQVSRHDPDEQIREYAAQAIRYIRKQAAFSSANAEPVFLRNVTFHDALESSQPAPLPRTDNWWITDLSFHVIVNVLGCLLFSLLIFPRFASAFLGSSLSETNVSPILRLSQAVLNAHLNELIVAGIILGVFSVFASVLTFRLTHQVATCVFNGANTFPGMLHDTLIPYTIMNAILYVLFFMASSVNPLVIFSTGSSPFSVAVTWVVIVTYSAAYVVLGHFIGKAYTFGTQKGFLSMVIAFFLCGFGALLLGALFGTH